MSSFMTKLNVFITLGLLVVFHLSVPGSAKHIGVCYGLLGDNLPPPPEVVEMYKSCEIEFVRIYEPVPDILEALRGSGLLVAVGPRNEEIPALAGALDSAKGWLQDTILPYINDVTVRWITIGNEVIPSEFAVNVPKAIANIQAALQLAGITNVSVTTVVAGTALNVSFPPSAGAFAPDIAAIMTEISLLLTATNSPLMLTVYPYFAYSSNPKDISLEYATFASPNPVIDDGGLKYSNLFDAMVDAFNAALEKIGFVNVPLAVAESGWPSRGNDPYTSVANAQAYNNNLFQHVTKNGTPRKPQLLMDTFHFAMFNENQKPGLVEQSFGLFEPNKQPVYPYC